MHSLIKDDDQTKNLECGYGAAGSALGVVFIYRLKNRYVSSWSGGAT